MKPRLAIVLEIARRLPPKWQSVTAGGLIAVYLLLTFPALLKALQEAPDLSGEVVGMAALTLLGWSGNIARKARAKGAK